MKLDYSALTQPASSADIDAYQVVYGQSVFHVPKAIRITGIIFVSVLIGALFTAIIMGLGEAVLPLVQVGIFAAIIFAFIEANKSKTKRRAKIYKFALMNDANYIVDVSEPGYSGAIFDQGHSRYITEALVLSDSTEIGNYTYTTGHGKNASEHHWGYIRVKLVRRLPHMLLDAKSNNIFGQISNLPQTFRGKTMSLEGDFDKHFTLNVPDNYQRDALYVMTPDVMAAIIDSGKNYDMEIIDDELFFYGSALDLSTKPTVETIMNIIEKIGGELRAQTDHYRDERAPTGDTYIIAEPGRRMKKRPGIGQISLVVVTIIIITYIIFVTNATIFTLKQ